MARARSGVTLVEIIVGSLVMVALLSAVYRIFRSSTYVMKAGMWTTNAQNQVRNTLTLLNGEIGRASVFSTVSATGVAVDPDPKYKLHYKSGPIDDAYNGPILKFYQCRSAITISSPPDPGAKVFCEVRKQGKKLIINKEKSADSGATEEKVYANRVLLDDIAEIRLTVDPAMANEQMAKALLNIVITVKDPQNPNRKVIEETKAKVDVEVVEL
jgi:hypothetical protein